MQVSDPNDIKIYNLSAGKSLPEWLSDRKRRALIKKDVDVRRRIELLQDFEMPGVSSCVRISKDGHYILATGIYKPRVRCYEVDNLSMKFERCFDSEVVAFEIISDDYTKLAFLEHDRFVEFHAGGGRYYRLRIPKYGRDLKYHYTTCDLLICGASTDIYRLNLERGQFLNSFVTEGREVNKLTINKEHNLVLAGTKEGKIEAWDPRARNRVGILDCGMACVEEDGPCLGALPSVTSMQFEGALTLGVGTGSGHVLLYDIRSDKPFKVKDHMNALPIKDVFFHGEHILSMDENVVKIWNRDTAKLFTYIECGDKTTFNNLCHVPGSGLMFIANENTKILAYYIPSLGPAPKWCSFLDNLTEELEESKAEAVYDDYKFVTKKELEELGLSNLIGTQMLRAYMHGFFIDIKLYNKAKSLSEPFAFEEYKKKKIREKIEEERTNRVQIKKLPSVNKDLALKLMDESNNPKKKKKSNLLEDDRFKALFENPDFQVDTKAEEYRLLNPVLTRLDKDKKKELKKQMLAEKFQPVQDEEEPEGRPSSEESSEESSDDEREWIKEVRQQHRLLKKEKELEERAREDEEDRQARAKAPKLYELRPGEEYTGLKSVTEGRPSTTRMTLEERIRLESDSTVKRLSSGNREMTFTSEKGRKKLTAAESMRKHKEERKRLSRPAPFARRQNTFKPYKKKRR